MYKIMRHWLLCVQQKLTVKHTFNLHLHFLLEVKIYLWMGNPLKQQDAHFHNRV